MLIRILQRIVRKRPEPREPVRTTLDVLCDLLEEFEGVRLEAYVCPAGVPTIGAGSTRMLDGGPVKMGDRITREESRGLLRRDASEAYNAAYDMLPDGTPPNAVAGWASFIYNVGRSACCNSNALARYKRGDMEGAEREFKEWRKGGGKVLPGLVRRREREWKLISGESR